MDATSIHHVGNVLFFSTLDEMVRCNMFGKVVLRYEIQGSYDVIRIVWSYVVKLLTQALKARICGNGKPLKPKTKMEYKTFAACTSMTGMWIVISTAAFKGRLLYAADAVNAFAQSGPLEKPCYLMVDEAFREWYYERNKVISLQMHWLNCYRRFKDIQMLEVIGRQW